MDLSRCRGELQIGNPASQCQGSHPDIEDKNYDLEKEVENKDYQINELDFQVHDFKGKFVKPSLKKVTKH